MSGVEAYGHYFIDDPAKFAMPGGGFKLVPIPPDDCISVIPVYSQATVDTLRAQLEAAQSGPVGELIEALRARAEAAEADATRWRTWRELGEHDAADIAWAGGDADGRDAAIDARIKEQQG